MDLSRREFLTCTAGAMLVQLPFPRPATLEQPRLARIIQINRQCSIPESVAGYHSALAGRSLSHVVIYPAILQMPLSHAQTIRSWLTFGATVVVESGAGFAADLRFRQHRRSLRAGLDVDVSAPVDLRIPHCGARRAPYIDYTWPYPAKVRDFSRVVPLGDQPGEIIAWADGLPVALRRQVGRGTLIVLGSPLGPALWAGDMQARSWLLDALAGVVPRCGYSRIPTRTPIVTA